MNMRPYFQLPNYCYNYIPGPNQDIKVSPGSSAMVSLLPFCSIFLSRWSLNQTKSLYLLRTLKAVELYSWYVVLTISFSAIL
jgi:hypothetical protein